jgi:signal transduction histidine kinase
MKPRRAPLRKKAQASRSLEPYALERFCQVLGSANNLDDVLTRALDAILQQSHAAAARVWLVNHKRHKLEFRLHRGLFPEVFSATLPLDFNTSPAGRAAESLKPVHLTDPDSLNGLRDKGFVELVSVPLIASGKCIAVLDIAARHRGELKARTLKWIESMGWVLALAIEKAQSVARAESREADLRRLWKAGLEVADAQEYAQILRTIVDRARELVGGEASALCLWDDQKRWWVVQGTSGTADAFQVDVKKVEIRENFKPEDCPVIRFKYRQAHIDVPVMHDGRLVGCLCVANQQPREFSQHEQELLASIAAQAAHAIDTARRLESAGTRATTVERERLAREMHDTLAQLLGFVNTKTQAARDLLSRGHADQAQTQLDQLARLAQELYADTRELILGLHSETGPERGLVPALSEYTKQFSEFSGIETSIEMDGFQDLQLAPTIEVQLIRVVQEALSNIRKHADARSARVHFEQHGDFARVEITDDGGGFDPSNIAREGFPRFGLTSMRERVEAIGGTFTIESAVGRGTSVQVEFPLVYRGEK